LLGFALAFALAAAPAAWAGVQMYQGSWIAQSFGNDNTTGVETESKAWSVVGVPRGNLCNALVPRCPFSKTGAKTGWSPSQIPLTPKQWDPRAAFCVPLSAWGLLPTRPTKHQTASSSSSGYPRWLPPLYRAPNHFTPGGAGKATACSDATTVLGGKATKTQLTTNDPRLGKIMKGHPVRGTGYASTTAGGAFSFAAAPYTRVPGVAGGMRRTTSGSASNFGAYLYSYTYARLRNATGSFGPAGGFFSAGATAATASFPYSIGSGTVARAVVKKGAGNFGGTMQLLGRMTTKVCYLRNGGCSLGENDWRYDAIGASGLVGANGVLSDPYTVMYSAVYYNTLLMQQSTVMAVGDRFPWTTGSVTVTATGRGPNNTIERRHGYDNRVAGVGTVQMVSPIITKWLQPAAHAETGGIAVLRIRFVPEPLNGLMGVAGLFLLGALYRARRR
jgi:hypothetical protein